MTKSVLWAYSTYPDDQKKALLLAETLIREGLAACVNIGPSMISIYQWEGEIKQEREFPIVIKTAHYEALERRFVELHPYSCPCLLALPVERGYAPYLDWVKI